MLWVLAAIGIPCAAKRTGQEADGLTVLDVCILGQHLPQMYHEDEIRTVDTPEQASGLGMCPQCLGYGTTSELEELWPYSVDEIPNPCEACGGTGRPCLRVSIKRSHGTIDAVQNILTHAYIQPGDIPGIIEGCLGCGEGPRHHYHVSPN